jgi:hypothetical protein
LPLSSIDLKKLPIRTLACSARDEPEFILIYRAEAASVIDAGGIMREFGLPWSLKRPGRSGHLPQ